MSVDHVERIIRFYYPALILEGLFSRRERKAVRRVAGFAAASFALAGAVTTFLAYLADTSSRLGELLPLTPAPHIFYGAFLVAAPVWVGVFALDAFFNSYYFRAAPKSEVRPNYEVAELFFRGRGHDFIKIFLESRFAERVLLRAGISRDEYAAFLKSHDTALDLAALAAHGTEIATLTQLSRHVLRYDKALAEFLLSRGVSEITFRESARWVERLARAERASGRWWSGEHLRSVRGLGEGWAYGETYLVDRYARDIRLDTTYRAVDLASPFGERECELVESVLARGRENNAVLVGEEGVGKRDIIARLAKRIDEGVAPRSLLHKRVYVLFGEALVAANAEKGSLERELIRLLEQTTHAGNLILVIQDFPALIASARAAGVDLVDVFEPYLGAEELHVVATSDPESFHASFARNPKLAERFEEIRVDAPSHDAVIRILQDTASGIENDTGLFFTYPALEAIAESAENYFSYGVMPDKAIDLLFEVVGRESQSSTRVVTRDAVDALVGQKTGIAVGAVTPSERDRLVHLEDALHARVIGQDEAIVGIANALRRARSGLEDSARPMGSFLFLGPTGVGKTETAKALAQIFFGDEDSILRLDMSEYASADGLERLIGSFKRSTPGMLATLLRDQPYGVLLLDEFEKAHRDVHNLFLQILDEGFFADAKGKRVSARNVIIIATSNAGSDFIWKLVERHENPALHKRELIDVLVARESYRPELLNRFDDVVVFHPLDRDHLHGVARKLLGAFTADLKHRKGITLDITDELVETLVEKGYDPTFGARPMRRAMQEYVEDEIARRIIAREIHPGDHVTLA